MTCSELTPLPFPACATTLILPEAVTAPSAPPHAVRLRNLATDRRERLVATVDGGGTLTVTLPQPLVAGHEYALELLDNDGTEALHELTLCGDTGYVVRLRPVLELGPDGLPVVVGTVTLACP